MVRRNGFHRSGRQRFFCTSCRRSFLWTNPGNRENRQRVWFERWLMEGYSIRQLSRQSGHHPSKLYRIVRAWLDWEPPQARASLERHRYTLFDGSYFRFPEAIVVLMDAEQHTLIQGAYGVNERSEPQLRAFFQLLKDRDLMPISCTVDGNRQIARVLKQIWPEIVLQRCLVHVQRQGLSWCRQRPRRPDARELRGLFLQLMEISTAVQRDQFMADLADWEQEFGSNIAARPERGRVFSDVKRARSMLLRALPDLFHYLEDPNIPRTTNGLEGYFSRMKKLYRNHGGLTRTKNYCLWYFKLVPK